MLTDFVITVISSVALSAALSGLLLWITKLWITERLKNAIKAEYDTKLETYKAQLKAQSDVEIEQLKYSLSITASKRNTTFTELHTRRADVIANTYAKLKKLHDSVASYIKPFEVNGERTTNERRKDVVNASCEFTPYYSQNQIFLSQSVAEAINQMNKELISITNLYIYTVDLTSTPDFKQWIEIIGKFEGNVRVALDGLEKQLRQLLGDES